MCGCGCVLRRLAGRLKDVAEVVCFNQQRTGKTHSVKVTFLAFLSEYFD